MNAKRVIALGFFDGIHLGHGALLTTARKRADALHAESCLLTFDTHPDTLVLGTPMQLINTMADRQAIAREYYGVDCLLTLHFDLRMMHMPWQEFIRQILAERYAAVHVVCGQDFRFGDRGLGTAEKLLAMCNSLGIGCDVVPEVVLDGVTVSSTYIRQLLRAGDVEQAKRFLGHPHRLSGVVRRGHRLGRELGSPTANIAIAPEVLPPKFGVYVVKVWVEGAAYPAVANVGVHPTVGAEAAAVEAWLLDFDGDLYGHTVHVDFYARLRDEQTFPSLEMLKNAIQQDAARARAYFQEHPAICG